MLRMAAILCLIGLLSAIPFFIKTSGATVFIFTIPGTGFIMMGIFIFGWTLYYDFKQQHTLFKEETFPADTVIFKEGDIGENMYIIREGTVEIYRKIDGKEKIIRTQTKGEYFGEVALLAEGRRTASVKAVTKLKVVTVGRKNFHALISNMPVVGEEFMRTFEKRAHRT